MGFGFFGFLWWILWEMNPYPDLLFTQCKDQYE